MTEDRRKSKRFQLAGIKSKLSDDSTAFLVVVDDVSATGVGLSKVPEGFDETVRKCFAVINAPLEDFNLTLQPRWVHPDDQGGHKRIGFHIEEPPPEWIHFIDGLKEDAKKGSQREASRHKIIGLMAIISDGTSKYFGIVEDLSEKGLRLTNIPAEFDESGGDCSAVVRSPTGDVHVSLHPCWIRSTNKGMYKTMGFKIHNPPPGWQRLIEELERNNGELGFLVVGEEEKPKDHP